MICFALLTILLITFENCKGDIDPNSLFVTKTLVTFNEALQTCKSRGMKLVRVDSAEDNAVVNGFANKVMADAYWIDGNDHNAEGIFVDSKGKLLNYKNFGPNEPNGGRGENCINVYRVPSGFWNDIACVVRIWAICQKDPNLVTSDQLEIEGSIFVASKSKISFADAKEYCIVRGLRMVRVNHVLDNSIVHSFARETNSDYYWVDGNDIATEGQWVDADGNELVHKNFHPGEPNGNRIENCAHGYLNIDGLWNDIRCDLQLWAICYNESRRGVTTDPNALIASHERLTWNEAQDYCKAQGYKMVKVDNAGQNAIVHGFTRRIWADLYWLDGNDAKTEGRWVDYTDNDLKHKGFALGEPNGGVNENCLNGYTYIDALMNDFPCTYKNLYAICARDSLYIRFAFDYELDSEKMLVSTDRYTYNEALQFCRTRGTQLARVNSAADNQAVAAFAKRVVADYYWIDANDYTEEGKWVDSNGKEKPYKNWAANEPNGNRVENCVFSFYLEEGTWRDIVCSYKYLAICTFAEFRNLHSIVTNDSLSAELNISNEAFLLSPPLSDSTTNESNKLSLFEQIPISLYDFQQNQSGEIHELLSLNSNEGIIRNLKNDFIAETKIDIHSEKNIDVNNIERNDAKYQTSIFNENINIEPNLSYVIIDKASFVNLLEKSQLSHNDSFCNYSLSHYLSVNATPTVIPITSMKYNLISNPFHSPIESKTIEENFSFKKLNDLPITGTQIFIQDNPNNERDVPIFFGTDSIFDNVVTYQQPQSNFANYNNSFNILNNTVNLNPTEITHSIKTEICTTNFPSDLSQLSSTSSQYNGEYKVETMIISDNEETNDDQLCLVCGDLASCQHYGVKSCEGCKGFFKRTIQKNASPTYVCLHSQNCVIDKQNRNRCQFCRYVKCIKVGMVKEIVRKESLKGRRGRLSSKVKMKNSGAQSLYTVVNLLSTIKTAVEISEPKGLEKLTLKEFHSIDRFQKKIKSEDILSYVTNELHESLKVVKQFAEKLIGFNTLSKRDQTLILVLNGLEFITLRAALRLFSDYLTTSKSLQESTRGSIILDNGCILTKSFLTRSIFSSWSNQTQELSNQLAFLHKNDKEIVNGILAVTLLKIEIDSEESKQLEDASLVYSLRHRYIEVLKTYCNSKMLLDTKISPTTKATKKSVAQTSKPLKQNCYISDPKFLSKLLDKQINVQSIVKSHLLKPIIKQYFNTDNINDCDKVFKNLLSGQEIISFCPKWLFKLIAYKTMPHLCTQQL